MTEDSPTLLAPPGPPRDLDGEVEVLAQQIVDVINGAGPELRPGLRQYAIDFLRDGTEIADARPPATAADGRDGNPLGIGLLLGMFALPMMLLFFPVGLVLLAMALVLSLWGLVAMAVRR